MKVLKWVVAGFVLFGLVVIFPLQGFADNVDKCFSNVDKVTDKWAKKMESWTSEIHVKKSNDVGKEVYAAWTKAAKCLKKKYKPKKGSGKPEKLEVSLMRGNESYNDTNGEKWLGQGIINKCIGDMVSIYTSTEKELDSAEFKKLGKKEQKAKKKDIMSNQKKIIRGTLGSCFDRKNASFKKRLKVYFEKYYEKKK